MIGHLITTYQFTERYEFKGKLEKSSIGFEIEDEKITKRIELFFYRNKDCEVLVDLANLKIVKQKNGLIRTLEIEPYKSEVVFQC